MIEFRISSLLGLFSMGGSALALLEASRHKGDGKKGVTGTMDVSIALRDSKFKSVEVENCAVTYNQRSS